MCQACTTFPLLSTYASLCLHLLTGWAANIRQPTGLIGLTFLMISKAPTWESLITREGRLLHHSTYLFLAVTFMCISVIALTDAILLFMSHCHRHHCYSSTATAAAAAHQQQQQLHWPLHHKYHQHHHHCHSNFKTSERISSMAGCVTIAWIAHGACACSENEKMDCNIDNLRRWNRFLLTDIAMAIFHAGQAFSTMCRSLAKRTDHWGVA